MMWLPPPRSRRSRHGGIPLESHRSAMGVERSCGAQSTSGNTRSRGPRRHPRRGSRCVGAFVLVAVLALVASACTLRTEAHNARAFIGAGATNPSFLDDPDFARVLGQQFNSLSPEN